MSMEVTDYIIRFFNQKYPFNQDGLAEFADAFLLQKESRHTLLIKPDQKDRELRFLTKGIVRDYYAVDDKEHNINFYTNPQFITDFSSFDHDTSVRKWQEALTDIELLVMPRSLFREFLKKYPCGEKFMQNIFREMLEEKEHFEYLRMTYTPEQLYNYIIMCHSDWVQLLPQYHIASFLGVKPETLSRIRGRIS